ncbi:MAG: D-alanyl-D-alanine carboxypeptidase family protein [Candidatus Saccharimonadales bacterium]
MPPPSVAAKVVTVDKKGSNSALPWPAYGQSAIGTTQNGLLATTDNQKPVPIASVAKVMMAYAVLKAKPLGINDQGPAITLNDQDVKLYNQYLSVDGSVVAVNSGEKISQRQALEAALLPSANNMADSLAIWAFGSIKNYAAYAAKLADQLGLKNTTISSASGFDVTTTSTASDLVRLGIAAMNNPVFAGIVGEESAEIPVAGTVQNFNYLLNSDGIVGVKTGNTDQAGGCYLFAARRKLSNGQAALFVGAILGADNLSIALNDSLPLLDASYQNFSNRTLVNKGAILAYYDLPWGGQAAAVASNDIKVWSWNGSDLTAKVSSAEIKAGDVNNTKVGKIQYGNQSADLILNTKIPLPTRSWRLWHRK